MATGSAETETALLAEQKLVLTERALCELQAQLDALIDKYSAANALLTATVRESNGKLDLTTSRILELETVLAMAKEESLERESAQRESAEQVIAAQRDVKDALLRLASCIADAHTHTHAPTHTLTPTEAAHNTQQAGDVVQSSLQSLRTHWNTLEAKLHDLLQQRSQSSTALKRETSDLFSTVSALNRTIAEIKGKSTARLKKMKEQFHAVETQLLHKDKQLCTETLRIETLQLDCEHWRRRCGESEAQRETEREREREMREALQRERDALRAQLVELQSERETQASRRENEEKDTEREKELEAQVAALSLELSVSAEQHRRKMLGRKKEIIALCETQTGLQALCERYRETALMAAEEARERVCTLREQERKFTHTQETLQGERRRAQDAQQERETLLEALDKRNQRLKTATHRASELEKSCAQLRLSLRSKEEEIEAISLLLQDERTRRREEQSNAQRTIESSLATLCETQSEVWKTRCDNLSQRLAHLARLCEDVNRHQHASKTKRERETEQLRKEIHTLTEEQTQLVRQRELSQEEVQRLQKTSELMKRDNDELRQFVNERNRELEIEKEKTLNLIAQLQQREEQTDAQLREISAREKFIHTLHMEQKSLEDKVAQQKITLDSLSAAHKQSLEEKDRQLRQHGEEAQQKLQMVLSAMQEKESERQRLQRLVDELLSNLSSSKEETKRLRQLNALQEDRHTMLLVDKSALQQLVSERESSLLKVREESDSKDMRVKELQERLAIYKREYRKQEKELARLVGAFQQEFSSLQTQLADIATFEVALPPVPSNSESAETEQEALVDDSPLKTSSRISLVMREGVKESEATVPATAVSDDQNMVNQYVEKTSPISDSSPPQQTHCEQENNHNEKYAVVNPSNNYDERTEALTIINERKPEKRQPSNNSQQLSEIELAFAERFPFFDRPNTSNNTNSTRRAKSADRCKRTSRKARKTVSPPRTPPQPPAALKNLPKK